MLNINPDELKIAREGRRQRGIPTGQPIKRDNCQCGDPRETVIVNTIPESLEAYTVFKESKSDLCFGCWCKEKQRQQDRAIAKVKIQGLFDVSLGTWYYSSISAKLGLDLELVVDICNELEEEGLIKEDIKVQNK